MKCQVPEGDVAIDGQAGFDCRLILQLLQNG